LKEDQLVIMNFPMEKSTVEKYPKNLDF
jgi:hypothetical protein